MVTEPEASPEVPRQPAAPGEQQPRPDGEHAPEHRPSRLVRGLTTVGFIAGQVLLLGSLFALYRMGRFLAIGRESEALENARDIWHLERLLDLPNEAAIQQFFLRSTELLELANQFYVGAHFPVTIIFLVWVLVRHRHAWPRVRNVIVISTGIALVVHILYPLAPPRFLPRVLPHVPFVDTGAVFGPSAYSVGDSVANQYAAMPSLHVGWAILVAWGVVMILRAPARWLALAHPILTTVVVVITANHYWLDGMVGGGLVLMAVWLTRPEVAGRIRSWLAASGAWFRGRSPQPATVAGAAAAVPVPRSRPDGEPAAAADTTHPAPTGETPGRRNPPPRRTPDPGR